MKLLFIKDEFGLGGVETLIMRLSELLVRDGHNVCVLTSEPYPGSLDVLPKSVQVIALGINYNRAYGSFVSKSGLKAVASFSPDIVFSTSFRDFWVACDIAARLRTNPKVLVGVYVDKEYCPVRSRWSLGIGTHLVRYAFDRCIPDESKLFMSRTVRRNHERSYNRSMSCSSVCVLPIDVLKYRLVARNPCRTRIVSVGRLVDFKTYNLYMLDVVRSLREAGIPVTWDVYGTGPLLKEMQRKALRWGLCDSVLFHGAIPYEQFGDIMCSAGVFVGMGTALLEAAACGVPSIVAVPHEVEGRTYGWVYDLPLGNVGEWQDTSPTQMISNLIENLIGMTEFEYSKECKKSQDYVRIYDQHAVYNDFLHCVDRAKQQCVPWHLLRLAGLKCR